jgi:hypothetical protein
MSGTPDICPACAAFVRHDWTDTCGNCGASLLPTHEVTHLGASQTAKPTPSGDKLNLPLLIGAVVVAIVVGVSGVAAANFAGNEKTDVELASKGNAGDELGNALSTSITPSTAPPDSTTTIPTTTTTQPAASDQDVVRAAAAKFAAVNSYDFTAVIGQGGQNMTQTGSWDGKSGYMAGTLKGGGIPEIETVVDTKKQTMYMKLPAELGGDPAKPWNKVDTGSSVNYGSGSANETVSFFTAAKNVKKTSGVTVDGVAAMRYRFDVDPQLFKQHPNASAQMTELINQYGSIEFSGEVAIDGDGNIRNLKIFMDLGTAGDFTMSMTFRNLNNAAKVSLPPANQISSKTLSVPSA